MASQKRNHTPKVKNDAKCSNCERVASAPVGKSHRHCPGKLNPDGKGRDGSPSGKGTWS